MNNSVVENIYHRVFIFSQTQMDQMMEMEKRRGVVSPVFGTVIVNGVKKIYTDILTNRNNIRYPDSRILIEGDIRSIKHTKSTLGK